jgi:predicted nucleic acid-binding protein
VTGPPLVSMQSDQWLIDKSALARLGSSPQAAEWAARIQRGLVRITTVTLLEVGYSARSSSDVHKGLNGPPVSSMPVEYLTPAIEDRAVAVLTSSFSPPPPSCPA